jgi:hypothetical protein
MKKYFLIIAALAIVMAMHNLGHAQNSQPYKQGPKDLRGKIAGKWKEGDAKSTDKGVWEFQVDGTFVSSGGYWGTKKGLYRTDEGRSVVIIEIDEDMTEWAATFDHDALALKEITEGNNRKLRNVLLTRSDL